jgi:alpha-beta hydrolase superfamily lysophospholipase
VYVTSLLFTDGRMLVRLPLRRKIAGMLRGTVVPLNSVRGVRVVPDGLVALRELGLVRAPGLALPTRSAVGTWRGARGRTLVDVRRGAPAVLVDLEQGDGQRWRRLLVTVEDPASTARAVEAARAAAGAPVRHHAVDLSVDRPTGPLAGTLLTPEGPGPWPTALLLPGSGPVDRNSDARRMPLGVTRALAEALASAGVASYRYDKRGVGASPGDWRRPGLYDGADDARAALRLLASRPEVDPTRLVLVGHSEGAILAAAVAADGTAHDGPALAGICLLSPTARPGEEVLVWQAERLAPGLPAPVRLAFTVLRTDAVAQVRRNHARLKATTTDVARLGGVRTNARWSREFMAHDPTGDLRRLTLPVLAITGSKDLQSPPDDLTTLADLVPGPVETHLVPDVTHLLRHQPHEASLRRYRSEVGAPLDERVLRLVTSWARRVLSVPGSGGGS